MAGVHVCLFVCVCRPQREGALEPKAPFQGERNVGEPVHQERDAIWGYWTEGSHCTSTNMHRGPQEGCLRLRDPPWSTRQGAASAFAVQLFQASTPRPSRARERPCQAVHMQF